MINGKGWFIWKLHDVLMPEPEVLAEELIKYGFTHVLIKVADGTVVYNGQNIERYTKALQAKGIKVIGWVYVYLANALYEGLRAAERVKTLGLDGLVLDVESHAKNKGKDATKLFVAQLSDVTVPIGFSSFRFPELHPELEYDIWIDASDYIIPQVYWVGASNPAEQLDKSVRYHKTRWPNKPVVATGAAYHENGWQPKQEEIVAFAEKCNELGLTGYNFWEFANALRYGLYNIVCTLDAGELPDVEPVIPTTVTVKSPRGLNFRSEPVVTNSTIKMTLPKGMTGTILEEKIEENVRWEYIKIEGWVASDYYGSRLAEVK